LLASVENQPSDFLWISVFSKDRVEKVNRVFRRVDSRTASGQRADDGGVEAGEGGEFPTILAGGCGEFGDFGEGSGEVIFAGLDLAEEGAEVVGGGVRRGRVRGEEPEADEAVKREIGDEVFGGKNLHGGGTRVVS